jgi:hypothetical protein
MKCEIVLLKMKRAEMIGKEDEAGLCTGLTFKTAVWSCPVGLMGRLGWEFYLAEDGGTSDNLQSIVSAAGSSRGLQKRRRSRPKGLKRSEYGRKRVGAAFGPWKHWGDTCRGQMKLRTAMKRRSGEVSGGRGRAE